MSVIRGYIYLHYPCVIHVRDPFVFSMCVVYLYYPCVLFMSLIHPYSQCVLSTCLIHVCYPCVLPLDQDLPSLCLRLLVCDFDRYQRHVVVGEVMTEMDKVEWPPEMELDFCQHLQPPIEVRDIA